MNCGEVKQETVGQGHVDINMLRDNKVTHTKEKSEHLNSILTINFLTIIFMCAFYFFFII